MGENEMRCMHCGMDEGTGGCHNFACPSKQGHNVTPETTHLDRIEAMLNWIVDTMPTKKVSKPREPISEAEQTLREIKALNEEVANDGFNRWWAMYPLKKGKVDAHKAWMKRTSKMGESHMKMFAAMLVTDAEERIKKDAAWSDKKFIPHPATYIRGEKWHDDITPIETKPEPKPVYSQAHKPASFNRDLENSLDATNPYEDC